MINNIITKIDNIYYNLTDFVDKHPAGVIPIELTNKRDSTGLFYSHHQFSNGIKNMLKKYKITESDEEAKEKGFYINSDNSYDWDLSLNSEFYKELKSESNKILSKNIKATNFRYLEMLSLFLLFCSQYYFFIQGNYFSLFTMPLTLWIFGVNSFHDGSHFSINNNGFINNLFVILAFWFSSPFNWYHQHIVGHHVYTNIKGKDPDLYHLPKFVRHSDDIKKNKYHLYQHVSYFFTWTISVLFGLVIKQNLKSILNKKYNKIVELNNTKNVNNKSLLYHLVITLFIMYCIPLFIHGLTLKGFLFAFIPYNIASVFFMISSQINHFTPDNTDIVSQDKNFFIHQIQTSHNVATNNYIVYLFTGGLNFQIEHHLFPSVNHTHLHKLAPLVKTLCLKYNIKYNESPSLWSALKKHYNHLYIFRT